MISQSNFSNSRFTGEFKPVDIASKAQHRLQSSDLACFGLWVCKLVTTGLLTQLHGQAKMSFSVQPQGFSCSCLIIKVFFQTTYLPSFGSLIPTSCLCVPASTHSDILHVSIVITRSYYSPHVAQ